MKRNSVNFSGITFRLFFFCLSFYATPSITSAQTNVSLTVNPHATTITIPDDYIGMSHEMSDIGQSGNVIFDSTNTKYVNYHQSMGVKSVRIGANLVDYSVWSNGPRTATTPVKTLTTTDVDNFFGFMQKINGKAIFGLNFAGHFDPSLAAKEAAYICQKHRPYLHSLEIGNEPDYYHFHNDLKPTTYYYNDWKPQYTQYINAIYGAVPNAPISGPTTAGDYTTFTKPYSIDFKGKFNLLTHHHYSGQPRTIAGMLSTAELTALNTMGTALNAMANTAGVGYRMSEFNSFAGGGAKGASDVYASALWALDAMYYMATLNCKGVNFHNANDLASPYTPIKVISPTSYEPRPVCYGIIAFNQGSKGKLTQLNLNTSNANLRAYSVIGEGHRLYVTIINKDAGADFNLQLNPGDAHYTVAQGMRLTGTSLSSNDNVSFAGSSFDGNGIWNPSSVENFSRNGNTFNVSVPRASAVVVTFSYSPITLPGKIEVENYIDSAGITSGTSGDVGGGKVIGHISNGDWVDYEVNVAQTGYYNIAYRVASGSAGGSIILNMNQKQVSATSVPGTGGWNNWITVTDRVFLKKGIQLLQLKFNGSAGDYFNINWVNIISDSVVPINNPPVVSFATPANNASYSAPASITVNVNASDADGSVSNVVLYLNNILVHQDNTAPYQFGGVQNDVALNTLSAGTYSLKAVATDNKGATSSAAITIIVNPVVTTMNGISGPACVTGGGIYTYTVNPESAPGTISWWSNSAAVITVDASNKSKISLNIPTYMNGTSFTLTAGVNLSVAPWYKEYNQSIKVGGCPAQARVAVSPLPFNQETTISMDNSSQLVSVKVYDLTGLLVYSADNIVEREFTLGTGLAVGIYVIHVTTADGEVSNSKLMKQ